MGNCDRIRDKIVDGAVTIEKTDGVVGVVPVGSVNATIYANFWIE